LGTADGGGGSSPDDGDRGFVGLDNFGGGGGGGGAGGYIYSFPNINLPKDQAGPAITPI
jgi:hypothetical protein